MLIPVSYGDTAAKIHAHYLSGRGTRIKLTLMKPEIQELVGGVRECRRTGSGETNRRSTE